MLDDPSKTSRTDSEKTRLILPGTSTSHKSDTVTGTTIRNNDASLNGKRVRLSLALIMLSLVATTALVLGMLFAVLPQLAQPKHSANTAIHKPTSAVPTNTRSATVVTQTPQVKATATPIPATAIPIQATVTIGGFSIIPNHFTVRSDCKVDDNGGYKCKATLYAAKDAASARQWSAASQGVATKFSPESGSIDPGHKQQVSIYIYNQCPYNGTLVFSIAEGSLIVPVNC